MIDLGDGSAVGDVFAGWLAQRDVRLDGPLQRIAGGLDTYIHGFSAVGWDGPLILRIYPSPARVPSAEREAAVLRFVGERGFPVPRCVAVETDLSVLGVPFLVLERVPGVTGLDAVGAKPWRAPVLLDAFAATQAALHRLPVEGWPYPEDADGFANRLAAAEGIAPTDPAVAAAVDALRSSIDLVREAPSVVCHFDLHPINVLVDAAGAVRVIDWENAQLGDPMCDLARSLVTLALGPSVAEKGYERVALRRLGPWIERRWRRGYGPVDERRLRWWVRYHAVDGWLEARSLLDGTFDRATQVDTRLPMAAAAAGAMQRVLARWPAP